MILDTMIKPLTTHKSIVPRTFQIQLQYSSMLQQQLQSVLSTFLDFIPKVVSLLPTSMSLSCRSWVGTLRHILDIRSALISLTSKFESITGVTIDRIDSSVSARSLDATALSSTISASPVLIIMKDIRYELNASIGSLVLSFQDALEFFLESSYMDDICRQDWGSNTVFRKSQQLTYGITAALLTVRGIVHDLLTICARPYTCHLSTPSLCHAGTVSTMCVIAVSSTLKIVSEYYSTLDPSRIRLPQWSADLRAVINSSVEILQLLHNLGAINLRSIEPQPEFKVFDYSSFCISVGSSLCATYGIPIHKSSTTGSHAPGQSVSLPSVCSERDDSSANLFESCNSDSIRRCIDILGASILTDFVVADINGQRVTSTIREGIANGLFDGSQSSYNADNGIRVRVVNFESDQTNHHNFSDNQLNSALTLELSASLSRDGDQRGAIPALDIMRTVSGIDMDITDHAASPRAGFHIDIDSPRPDANSVARPTNEVIDKVISDHVSPSLPLITLADIISCLSFNRVDVNSKQTAGSINQAQCLGSMSVGIIASLHPVLCMHDSMTLYDSAVDSSRMRPSVVPTKLTALCSFCRISGIGKMDDRPSTNPSAGKILPNIVEESRGDAEITAIESVKQIAVEKSKIDSRFVGCTCYDLTGSVKLSRNVIAKKRRHHISEQLESSSASHACGCRPNGDDGNLRGSLVPLSFDSSTASGSDIDPRIVTRMMCCESSNLVKLLLKRYELKGLDTSLLVLPRSDQQQGSTATTILPSSTAYPKLTEIQLDYFRDIVKLLHDMSAV